MGLKQDAEIIVDRASRIVALIYLRQQTRIAINENEDAALEVTPAMKQGWNDRITTLTNEIKSIVAGW